MKPLSELTLMDRFLFACAMEDSTILQAVLQIILNREVILKDNSQTEKELRTTPWLRSVRLDVITMDQDDSVYNTEVQKKNTGNLVKRSRFYQSLIDSSLLAPGEIDFNQMPSAYLITIAPFDLFGYGNYCYSFRMKCREVDDLWLEDGVTRIFLNTRGRNADEVSPELVALLHYFEKTSDEAASSSQSERIREIHKRICNIKASEEIGVKYMQAWEEKIYDIKEAKELGIEQGRELGIELGIEQGRELGIEQGRELGIEQGRELERQQALQAFILDYTEEGIPKERILAKLQKNFNLDAEKAEDYFNKFSIEV